MRNLWVNKVPVGWEIVSLGYVLVRNDSGVWGEESLYENGTPVLRSTEVSQDGSWNIIDPAIRKLSSQELRIGRLIEGDLVLTKSSGSALHLGKVALVNEEIEKKGYAYSNFMQRLRSSKKMLPKFLFYVLNSQLTRSQINYWGLTTSGLVNLNRTLINKFITPIPPLEEQKKIAEFLDQKVARIDEAIAKKKKLVTLLEEKRISTIQKNIYQNGGEKRKLKFIASLVYGDSLPSEVRDEEGEIPVYGSFGPVGLHNKANTKGPVLIVGRKGSYGKVMYSDVPVFVIDTAYFIDPTTSKCSLRWLYYVLRVTDFQGSSLDTGVPGLSREFAHNYEIPYYGKTEQEKIASYLDKKMQSFDNVQSSIKKSVELLEEYKISLISNAVTGKVKI